MNALELLQSLDIDTTSRINALRDVKGMNFDREGYIELVHQLTGDNDYSDDDHHARFTALYLVTDIVEGQKTDSIDLASAHEKAVNYLSKNKWVMAERETTSYYKAKTTVDALGNPRQKKGAKKEKAIKFWNNNQGNFSTRKEWVNALMENIGLTQAGASTYYHNLKTGQYK